MDLGKYKRAIHASTRPKHLRRVIYQPEIGQTDVDFPDIENPRMMQAAGGLVKSLFVKLRKSLPVSNDVETLMSAKALDKAIEGVPMSQDEVDFLMKSGIMDDTMQRMKDDMDMSEEEAYDALIKSMQIGKPKSEKRF